MSEKNSEFTFEHSEQIDNIKIKRKIKTLSFQVEFNTLMNLLKDLKAMRTFMLREMHGICAVYKDDQKEYLKKDEFFLIFPKKKNENLELNQFFINNISTNNIFVNNYVLKGKLIYNEEWEKYKKVIYRFECQTKIKEINSNIIKNETDKNEIINYSKEDIKFIESVFSFYLDINNSSTTLINEIYYNTGENEINRVCDILNIYYEKANDFIGKNLNMYLCTESILINRSMDQIFNYIISLKLFYHKKFEIKDIQKYKDEINIFVDIRDQIYQDSYFQCRCHILKLSEISCFVSVIALIDVKHFSFSKRFLMLKSAIIIVLKKLKKKIESELIEN